METLRLSFILVFIGIGILGLVQIASAQEIQNRCVQGGEKDLKITEEDIARLNKCLQSVGVKDMEDITAEKLACSAKCILEEYDLLDETGKPHRENMFKGIETYMHESVKEEYKKALDACIDEYGANMGNQDETCQAYVPFTLCVTEALKKVCTGG